jgi:ribose transport system substrate-binding protein
MHLTKSVRVFSALFCALATAIIFAACTNPGTNSSTTTGTGGKHKLAFVTNNASDFWAIARKGTEKAAKEIPGIEVEFRIT